MKYSPDAPGAANSPSAPNPSNPSDSAGTPDERNAISLLREIQSGRTSGKALGKEDRRRVVEHLLADGYGVAETAEILNVSDRTLARDRAAIREANALAVGPGFVEETVGELRQHADRAVNRLRRLAREKDAPHQSRVEAERAAWQVERDLAVMLQRLGYLPTAPHQFIGRIHASGPEEPMTNLHLQEEATRLLHLVREGDGAKKDKRLADTVKTLERVRKRASRGADAERLAAIRNQLATEGENDGARN